MTGKQVLEQLGNTLLNEGTPIKIDSWQGLRGGELEVNRMIEVINPEIPPIHMGVYESINIYDDIKPYIPWAIEHLYERTSTIPSNPGTAYKSWPHFKKEGTAEIFTKWDNKFFSTYQERIWVEPLQGVRFKYGNLHDVIELLKKEKGTRQAFLPLFFPEDTGVTHNDRAFCSIGYHFIIRNDQLHCTYWLRSADLVRHFKNDIFFAIGLSMYVLKKLWATHNKLKPGRLFMYVTSLHVFETDLYNVRTKQYMRQNYDEYEAKQRRVILADSIPYF